MHRTASVPRVRTTAAVAQAAAPNATYLAATCVYNLQSNQTHREALIRADGDSHRATRPPPDPHRTDPYLVYGLRQSRAKSPKRRCPPLGHSDNSLQLLEVKADLHVGEFVTILKVSPHTELPDPHRTPIGPPRGSLPRAYAHGSTAACPTFVSRT